MKNSRSKEYFINCLNNRLNVISNYEESNINLSGIELCRNKIGLAINLLNIATINYSIGKPKEELIENITPIIKLINDYWHPDLVRWRTGRIPKYSNRYILNYNFFIRRLLSLYVLLDFENEEFEICKKMIDRDKIQDGLYDFLLSYKFRNRDISKKINPNIPKNNIIDIILEENKEKCERAIKTYLEKHWYKTYKNAGWYDSHLLPEERYTFYGYWAFEVAAIVKIKGLDDSSFRDNVYFPKDLV